MEKPPRRHRKKKTTPHRKARQLKLTSQDQDGAQPGKAQLILIKKKPNNAKCFYGLNFLVRSSSLL